MSTTAGNGHRLDALWEQRACQTENYTESLRRLEARTKHVHICLISRRNCGIRNCFPAAISARLRARCSAHRVHGRTHPAVAEDPTEVDVARRPAGGRQVQLGKRAPLPGSAPHFVGRLAPGLLAARPVAMRYGGGDARARHRRFSCAVYGRGSGRRRRAGPSGRPGNRGCLGHTHTEYISYFIESTGAEGACEIIRVDEVRPDTRYGAAESLR